MGAQGALLQLRRCWGIAQLQAILAAQAEDRGVTNERHAVTPNKLVVVNWRRVDMAEADVLTTDRRAITTDTDAITE